MTSRTAIVVLGSHRSGTSALTRMLSLLGASLPRNLYAAGLGNETGHWEPEAAIRLNDQILDLAGSPVNDVFGPSAEWLQQPAAQAFVDRLKDLIADEYGDDPLFVLKDPRISLLFPLWRAALARLDIRCVAVVVARNPVEVARSLAERQGLAGDMQSWPLERGGLLWLRYNLAAEEHTRSVDRAFCDYSTLLDDWRSVARRLSDELNIAWPRSVPEAAHEIDGFLSPDLRHHREHEDLNSRQGVWSAWIAPIFAELRGAAEGRVPDSAVFSAVKQSFGDVYARILHPPAMQSAVRPRLCVMSRGAGRQKLCLVGGVFWKPALGDSAARAAVDAAMAADIDVSIVDIGAFTEADEAAFAEFAESHSFDIEYLDIDGPPIQPSFLAPTIQVLRYLRARHFDAILFQDRDGLGYASVVAKQTGMAFASTSLVVVAAGSSGWIRQQNGEFPSSLVTIGIEHLERMALELADFSVPSRPESSQWMVEQGWRLASSLLLGDGDEESDDGWRRVFQQVLAANTGIAVQRTPLNDAADTTVIITHHEQPDLIEQNLQGLMQQTEKGFSVLVVDDGSKSEKARRYLDTVEKRYQSLNLKLIRQENRYLGAARNAGIGAATTEFVILLDDDNVAFPDMVRTLRRAAHTSNADVVTFGLKHFHEETQPPSDAAHGNGTEHFFSAGPILLGSIHNCFGDGSAIYRTDVFGKVGGFHEIHGVTYEDWQMHLRIAASGFRILSLPEALLWYRIRKGSMLRSTRPFRNARVIASVIDALPCSTLAPLSDYLIGTELAQNELNRNLERAGLQAALERSTAQAIIAANGNALKGEIGRYVHSLQVTLEERSRSAEEAAHYARSLEETLAQVREANKTATEYARSLEQSRAEIEEHARALEAELKRINSAAKN